MNKFKMSLCDAMNSSDSVKSCTKYIINKKVFSKKLYKNCKEIFFMYICVLNLRVVGCSAVSSNSVYLGYSNNPFGSSTTWADPLIKKSKMTSNSSDFRNPTPSNSPLIKRPKSLFSPEENTGERTKRGVMHLYNMVMCATGCDPLEYKGYGCYCGFLGSGSPVDGIDRCCQIHDWCYDRADCPMFLEYFVPYLWKCYHRRPLCAVEHGAWGGRGSCAQRLCECDRALSECLHRYPCPRRRAVCTSSTWRLLQNAFMGI